MRVRVAALVVVVSGVLVGCTAPATTPTPMGSSSMSGGSSSPQASSSDTATATGSATPSGGPTKLPEVIVLSGTAIGGRPLEHAPAAKVDPMLVAKLGKAKVGQTALCAAEGSARNQLAVVDHVWPGLTVRYGSSGAAAVAMTWTVDLAHVPDGFRLDHGLDWRPTFATLRHMPDVTVTNAGGNQLVSLDKLRITWSGPVGSVLPDTVTGGPKLECA